MRDLSSDTALLSINTATLGPSATLRDAIDLCIKFDIGGIGPWRDKIHEVGLPAAARMIKSSGLRVTGLCRGGMFPAATVSGLQEAIDDNKRAIEEAAEIGAECLVLVVGGLPEGSKDLAGAQQQVVDGIGAILESARDASVPLAIEPLHPMYAADRACVNTLSHALDICESLGDGIGVAVDIYHVWWDPQLKTQVYRAGSQGRLLAYHVCDWLSDTRLLLTDRGMMGDGVIDIQKIRSWVEDAGFSGAIEVEIFSELNWWTKPAEDTIRTCITRHQTVV